nr:mitogen-activated protein kinase hog1 [Quercus suber]
MATKQGPRSISSNADETTCSSAKDQLTSQAVAVKKIMKPFSTPVLSKRTYRELKLLKHLKHENVISLSDIFISPLEDMYVGESVRPSNLAYHVLTAILSPNYSAPICTDCSPRGRWRSNSSNTSSTKSWCVKHSVVHRDLKPSNILVNENCDLKICDFGLARIQDPQMTGYVSTRYYRAPEIMLTWQKYDVEVDIWSAGCIFAEMLEGKPLFPGKDHVNQFSIITELLGTPPDDVISTICSENTLRFVQSLPKRERQPLKNKFKNADPQAIELLERMLVFDPRKRVKAGEALADPYLAPYHDPTDEPEAEEKFDWSFNDADLPVDTWKIMISDVLEARGGSGNEKIVPASGADRYAAIGNEKHARNERRITRFAGSPNLAMHDAWQGELGMDLMSFLCETPSRCSRAYRVNKWEAQTGAHCSYLPSIVIHPTRHTHVIRSFLPTYDSRIPLPSTSHCLACTSTAASPLARMRDRFRTRRSNFLQVVSQFLTIVDSSSQPPSFTSVAALLPPGRWRRPGKI